MTILLLIAAGVVWLWPSKGAAVTDKATRIPPLDTTLATKSPQPPTYQESLLSLSKVRHRLSATELLSEPCSKAIDTLVLALVHGSDR